MLMTIVIGTEESHLEWFLDFVLSRVVRLDLSICESRQPAGTQYPTRPKTHVTIQQRGHSLSRDLSHFVLD